MGFKEVFTFLQEIFPQVDLRILKAVAIEHANEVDAAVEFILLDVLPPISRFGEASCTSQDAYETQNSSAVGPEPVAYETAASNDCTNSAHVMSACIGEADVRDLEVGIADYLKGLECTASHYNDFEELNTTPHSEPNVMEKRIDVTSDLEDIILHPKSHMHERFVDAALCNMNGEVNGCLVSSIYAQDECSPGQQSPMGKSETMINVLHDDAQRLHELDSSIAASVVNNYVQNVPLEPFERNSDIMEKRKIMKDANYSMHGSEESECSLQPASQQELHELEANDIVSTAVTSSGNILASVCPKAADSWGCGSEVGVVNLTKLVAESIDDLLSFESGMLSVNNDNLPASLATRSGHFFNNKYPGDLISDSKNNKLQKNLLSAMELATNMTREVELLDERTKQAKEASSGAGQDVVSKVEELKNMLKHAKEANDTHAGEVYGKKAIFATEIQELHSRPLSLSDERNKTLSVIEEIPQTVQERLAAVEEEMAAAVQDKLEKEALVRKALSEQDVIMASVVKESKKLQQEAEANSKLREFLMDRGHIVDALQGEIAIICEDIMLLKERVDGHMPLSMSLPSAASSFAASSSSSDHRTKHSSDGVLQHEDFTENPPID